MAVPWGQIISTAAPLIAGYFSGRQNQKRAEQASGGARFANLMPLMQALLAQQQQQSAQNYQWQQQRYQQNAPLSDAVRRMAMGMLPTPYGGGMSASQSSPFSLPPLPSQAPSVGPAPAPSTADLMDDYQRRGGGTGGAYKGAGKGALRGAELSLYTGGIAAPLLVGGGALIGGIMGAVNKKAKTAPTDFMLGDAQQAIQRGYQSYLGREASPDELAAQLGGQGWQMGDRYVGEQGLRAVLNSLQNSDEARQYRGA